MADENVRTDNPAADNQGSEPPPYELKQVQVRLRLEEAQSLYSTKEISTYRQAAEVMSDVLAQMDREYFCVVNLDTKNRPINYNIVSIGDTDFVTVPPQNIFKSAILSNSARLLLLHNHPSGDPSPSMPDIALTEQVVQAGAMMNIPVVDHVIIAGGTGRIRSLLEEKPELFRQTGSWTKDFSFGSGRVSENGNAYGTQTIRTENREDSRAETGVYGSIPEARTTGKGTRSVYKSPEEKQKEALDEASKMVKNGVRKVFSKENYADYLRVMSRFHTYSFNNTVLIASQKPDAAHCAGFNAWKFRYGRHVMKGEKGIKILSPVKVKETVREEQTDPKTGQPVFDDDGHMKDAANGVSKTHFRLSTVFDVSQTEGTPMPETGLRELASTEKGLDAILAGLEDASNVQCLISKVPRNAASIFRVAPQHCPALHMSKSKIMVPLILFVVKVRTGSI